MPQRAPIWHQDKIALAPCPLCKDEGAKAMLLQIESLAAPFPQLDYVRCDNCDLVFVLDFNTPTYADDTAYPHYPHALKFYLEQGAGFESLALPPFIASSRSKSSYLEVGCGFGFGLDFAHRAFGWGVKGIDPSRFAREGSKDLGLDIDNRQLEAHRPGDKVYGAIAAIEVVEHIEDPLTFVRILHSNLTADGILIVSTPDGESIKPGADDLSLLPTLTPGYHVVLFSRKSLAYLLRAAGFTNMQIVQRGATLLAVAGPGAEELDIDAAFDKRQFRSYLEQRLATFDPQSPLGVGFAARLFKFLINNAEYEQAKIVQRDLAAALLRRDGIDIFDPHTLLAKCTSARDFGTYMDQLPACLAPVLYFSAMLRLNGGEGDRDGALAYLYACFVIAKAFRKAMQELGFDDGETADLEFQAKRHIKMVAGWMSDA